MGATAGTFTNSGSHPETSQAWRQQGVRPRPPSGGLEPPPSLLPQTWPFRESRGRRASCCENKRLSTAMPAKQDTAHLPAGLLAILTRDRTVACWVSPRGRARPSAQAYYVKVAGRGGGGREKVHAQAQFWQPAFGTCPAPLSARITAVP